MTAPPRIRPFPWGTLDPVPRDEARDLANLRRWAAQHPGFGRLPEAIGVLLGTNLRLIVRRVTPLAAARPLEPGVAVLLARGDAPQAARSALVVAERALVSLLVSRVVRRPPPRAINASSPPAANIAGAFAAIMAAAIRRAGSASAEPLRVLAAGPSEVLESDVVQLGPDWIAFVLTVLAGDEAFSARVVVARGTIGAAPGPAWDGPALAALGGLPLELPIVACAVRATATDVAALRKDDVFLPGCWPLSRTPCAPQADGSATASGLMGPVFLASPGADLGVRADLGEGGNLVLRGDLELLCATEAEMGEGRAGGLVEAVGDVPVVVRVEIGEARMAARDWAALGRGDVVALGRRIGERVVLRVGGLPVARGELVEIDGEVGVRILERLPSEARVS